ncbi:MAG: toll/interleukin-1 receptor domain-containing protein [Acidimicrobiia bacterium]
MTQPSEPSERELLSQLNHEFRRRGWRDNENTALAIVRAIEETRGRVNVARLARVPSRTFLSDNAATRRDVRQAVNSAIGESDLILIRAKLGEIASRLDDLDSEQSRAAREFDVFICHASEDKDDFVRPLALSLRAEGLTVWYDEFELHLGDSVRRKIDAGIANSRFGVIILSPSFFSKSWPQHELDGLVTRSVSGVQVLLPIWHGVTQEDVMVFSPSLADKYAAQSDMFTVDEIAAQIAYVVHR